jgi:hypothetical protein
LKKPFCTALCLVVLTAGNACASGGGTEPERLHLQMLLAPGSAYTYALTVKAEGRATSNRLAGVPVDLQMTGTYHLFVDSVAADGTAGVRYRFENLRMLLNNAEVPMQPQMAKPFEIRATLSPDGSLTGFRGLERLSGGMTGLGVEPGGIIHNLLLQGIGLPTSPVEIGGTWSTSAPFALLKTPQRPMKVLHTLQAIEAAGTRRVARIQRSVQSPLDLDLEAPHSISMAGSVETDGLMTFDLADGRLLEDVSRSRVTMALHMGEQDLALDVHLTMRVEHMP